MIDAPERRNVATSTVPPEKRDRATSAVPDPLPHYTEKNGKGVVGARLSTLEKAVEEIKEHIIRSWEDRSVEGGGTARPTTVPKKREKPIQTGTWAQLVGRRKPH